MTSAVIYDNDKYIYTLQTLKPRSEKHFVLRTSVKLDMVAHTGIWRGIASSMVCPLLHKEYAARLG